MKKTLSKTRLYTVFAIAALMACQTQAETDVTFLLTNPGFDKNELGWKAENLKMTSTLTSFHYPRTAYSACEFWSCTSDLYQVIEGVPNGRYTISCQGFFRDGDYIHAEKKTNTHCSNITAFLYANNDSMPLVNIMRWAQDKPLLNLQSEARLESGKFIPNDMASTRKYFDLGLYNNEISTVVTDGKLRIGIKTGTCIPASWYIFDNFKITYEGDLKGFTELIKNKLAKDAEELNVRNIAMKRWEEMKFTHPYLLDSIKAAYLASCKNEKNQKADPYTNHLIDQAYKQYGQIDSIRLATIEESKKVKIYVDSALHQQSPEISVKAIMDINSLENYINNNTIQMVDLSTYYTNFLSDYSYLVHRQNINFKKASRKKPIDVTLAYMRNPKFETATQWHYEKVSNLAYPRVAIMACEYWSSTSDTYQIIKNLPNGEYILSCQGFYRDGSNAKNYASFSNGSDRVMALLYANNITKPLTNILKGAQFQSLCRNGLETKVSDAFIPNTMPAAYVYFQRGLYVNSIRVKVTDGTLRYGVKCSEVIPDSWYIFTNYKLQYCGK